jgi:AraC-like DNA-binding protein
MNSQWQTKTAIDVDIQKLTGNYLAELLALALGTSRDGRESIELHGLRASRTAFVLTDIEKNAAVPGYGVNNSASKLGVSARYVHMLLESTGMTFSEHLLEFRLRKVYQSIVTPMDHWRKVSEIAYECGFGDLSYFNRSFRRRFGDSPSAIRAASVARKEQLPSAVSAY